MENNHIYGAATPVIPCRQIFLSVLKMRLSTLTYWVPTIADSHKNRLFRKPGRDFIDMETLCAFYATEGLPQKVRKNNRCGLRRIF